MRGIAALYGRLQTVARRIPRAAWLTRDHFLFFALAAVGLLLFMPRALVVMGYAMERFVLGMPVVKPALLGWPSMPTTLLLFVGASLLTFFLGTTARLAALVSLSVVSGFASGYLDVRSLPVFAVFLAASFATIRLPISRLAATLILCILALGLLLVSVHWFKNAAIATIGTFQMTLIPMLWYSAYEHKPPRRPLEFHRFAAYLYVRFFSGPVVTYGDMFTRVSGPRLAEVRFAGFKALYAAGAASFAAAGADLLWRKVQVGELTGLSLLLVSYVGYVGEYCKIVVVFNVVTGVLRLFGLPIRDNFNYWLLARTPNEHWQRWNLLFREWVITFVFFPIMRAKRWLFAAIMASLLASGLLHVIPAALIDSPGLFNGMKDMGYWAVNGLAIYLVLKIPVLFPRLVPALRMQGSVAWSIVGVVMTSSFYGVLFGVRASSNSWTDVARFFERLF